MSEEHAPETVEDETDKYLSTLKTPVVTTEHYCDLEVDDMWPVMATIVDDAEETIIKLSQDAREQGADAVVGMRIVGGVGVSGSSYVYGTAVTFVDDAEDSDDELD
ncbi:heavy-metal-binding family protein [Nocardiopsis alba]|uniref:Heavy-metal-binding family protein n=2 Tax=Nocardiopsis alba TaxID=53437 RepID=A0A7K2IR21_9ACTN|nr:heavy-metal-binding family protein [Nocardiopsis alba]AFR11158.1 heavy-metal-binding family protein [Nocardiopsis alba ATCC BAA-2165]MYR32401.1 heavy-metal-binding family protein [Nocardiopsis alba]